MTRPRWQSRLLHGAELLLDPGVREVLITSSGVVMTRRLQGTQALEPPLSAAQQRALVRELVAAMRVHFSKEEPEVSGVLDGYRVRVLGPPLVSGAPTIRIERPPELAPALTELVSSAFVTGPMAELLTRGLGQGSALIVGAAGTGKSQLLAALAREAAGARRLLLHGVSPERVGPELAARCAFAGPEASLDLATRVGADLVFAEEPSARGWLELLAGARPFVASLEAPDLTSGLLRLAARLMLERPGLSSEAAESLVESGLALVVELGQRAGELNPQVLAFAEPRRLQGRLSARVLARRRPEGGEELVLEGSRLSERLGAFGGRVSAPPAPSFVPDETHPERPEHLAMLSGGGLGVVDAAFAVENDPAAGGPVGRVGARELSMLRPEQLVSQSFLVDVSKEPTLAPGTRVRTWAGEDDGTADLEGAAPAPERASTSLSSRAPSAVEALEGVVERGFGEGTATLGEGASPPAGVDPEDEFGGVKTLPPSVPPAGGGRAPSPTLAKGLEGKRVGQDDGRTLILGGGSATPSPAPGDVVDRRGIEARPKSGPKVRE